jgi:hypothetical protein
MSTTLQQTIRRKLRQLLFQVHPDYFQSWPTQKKTNAHALQQLQSLLTPILSENKTFNQTTSQNDDTVSLTFYLRSGQVDKSVPFRFVQHTFPTLHTTPNYTFQLTEALFKLCEKAGIPPNAEETALLTEIRQTATTQPSTIHHETERRRKSVTASVRAQFLHGLRTSFAQMPRYNTPKPYDASMLQIFSIPSLLPDQVKMGRDRLVKCIELVPTGWWQLPVLIGLTYGRTPPGFLCVPFDLRPFGKW